MFVLLDDYLLVMQQMKLILLIGNPLLTLHCYRSPQIESICYTWRFVKLIRKCLSWDTRYVVDKLLINVIDYDVNCNWLISNALNI